MTSLFFYLYRSVFFFVYIDQFQRNLQHFIKLAKIHTGTIKRMRLIKSKNVIHLPVLLMYY